MTLRSAAHELQRFRYGRAICTALLLACSVFVAGCTPDKAKAIMVSANQFKVDANKAIDALEKMHRAELSPPPEMVANASAAFATELFNLKPTPAKPLDFDDLSLLLDPYTLRPNPVAARQWAEFIASLRQQYAVLAAMYTSLERGHMLAGDAVTASVPHAERLTAQLIGIAEGIVKAPPVLHMYRSDLVAELRRVHAIPVGNPERIGAATRLRERFIAFQKTEEELARTTVEQCLKAAAMGMELRNMLKQYDQLTLDDISFFANRAFQTASALTGKDLTSLNGDVNEAIQLINNDPVWKRVINDQALASAAAANRPR